MHADVDKSSQIGEVRAIIQKKNSDLNYSTLMNVKLQFVQLAGPRTVKHLEKLYLLTEAHQQNVSVAYAEIFRLADLCSYEDDGTIDQARDDINENFESLALITEKVESVSTAISTHCTTDESEESQSNIMSIVVE